ncbi:MAG TPA: sigma-54 dependent transcriptional regulator [Paludibaculum sp.]|jgi:DNA-binding NtrC family response regulator
MRLLVVDDDRNEREGFAKLLSSWGHEVRTAEDGLNALEVLDSFAAAVILTDLRMPRMDGFLLIQTLRSQGRLPPTIVLTAFGSLEMAVSTIHDLGGFWFLEKPVDIASLRVLLERAGAHSRLAEENRQLRQELSYRGALGELVGSSPRMMELFSMIRQVAPTSAPVLITGESGTGKELVARAIHTLSPRVNGRFVAVNCAAVPESLIESELFGHEKGAFTGAIERRAGCLELAQNGTLFLDELGEMPMPMQAKLLRVLEDFRFRRIGGKLETEVNVRVVAATNRPPAEALRDGRLREDLYYRINVFDLEVPPLRERLGDIPSLAEALIHNINQKHGLRVTGISDASVQDLRSRSWKGNVRELRNVLERAAILTGKGEIDVLPPAQPTGLSSGLSTESEGVTVGMTIDDAERWLIEATLTRMNGNKTRAAVVLGISAKTLHAKLRRYRGEPDLTGAVDSDEHMASETEADDEGSCRRE